MSSALILVLFCGFVASPVTLPGLLLLAHVARAISEVMP